MSHDAPGKKRSAATRWHGSGHPHKTVAPGGSGERGGPLWTLWGALVPDCADHAA